MKQQQLIDAKSKLDEATAAAKTAWNEFSSHRQELIERGIDKPEKDPEAWKRLDGLHQAYEEIATEAEKARDELVKALTGASTSGTSREGRLDGIADAFLRNVPGGIGGLKAVTTVGAVVPTFFDERIRAMPARQTFVQSVIPITPIDTGIFAYVRQVTATHAAAAVAAGALKPEAAYSLERHEDRVRVIAHIVTGLDRSLLSDFEAVAELLDAELRVGVILESERQILLGDGAGENMRGILNTVGIGTVAKGGAEPEVEAILRAVTTVRLANFEPTTVCLHPNVWQSIRLMKSAEGEYLSAPIVEEDPERLWGLEVISSPVMPAATALVGAFEVGARIYQREDATVAMSEEDSDNFRRNTVSLRGESRLGLAVERPSAFASVTALV